MGWAALLVLALALPRVAISVQPRVVWSGDWIHVHCTVARHADNRILELGLRGWASSQRGLDGERSPVEFHARFYAPCVREVVAYCALADPDHVYVVQRSVTVAEGRC